MSKMTFVERMAMEVEWADKEVDRCREQLVSGLDWAIATLERERERVNSGSDVVDVNIANNATGKFAAELTAFVASVRKAEASRRYQQLSI